MRRGHVNVDRNLETPQHFDRRNQLVEIGIRAHHDENLECHAG